MKVVQGPPKTQKVKKEKVIDEVVFQNTQMPIQAKSSRI
jgi:hypothetical protein